MNIKEIKQLVKLMVENDLSELDIASGDEKVTLKRGSSSDAAPVVSVAPVVSPPPVGAPAPQIAGAPPPEEAHEEPPEELLEIKSPMVGTYYSSAGPDSDSFVEVGTAIDEESVVCILEAMKVMNEIKADCAGVVAEVCIDNAQPVEFGQVLFRVRPA